MTRLRALTALLICAAVAFAAPATGMANAPDGHSQQGYIVKKKKKKKRHHSQGQQQQGYIVKKKKHKKHRGQGGQQQQQGSY